MIQAINLAANDLNIGLDMNKVYNAAISLIMSEKGYTREKDAVDYYNANGLSNSVTNQLINDVFPNDYNNTTDQSTEIAIIKIPTKE